jgi:hypothetical protein
MGRWGDGSDENDDTYNYAGLDIFCRLTGAPELSEDGKKNIWNDSVEEMFSDNTDVPLGYIILLIKAGAIIPKQIIENAMEKLKNKKNEMDEIVFNYEMKLCTEALINEKLLEPAHIFGISHYADINKEDMIKMMKDRIEK